MSRYKGASRTSALTVEDLVELVDIYHRLQAMHAGLNPVSSQRFPLMAAAATVKAAWAEVSGAEQAWSYPATYVAKPGERKPTGF